MSETWLGGAPKTWHSFMKLANELKWIPVCHLEEKFLVSDFSFTLFFTYVKQIKLDQNTQKG